jgi:hypothetical protein
LEICSENVFRKAIFVPCILFSNIPFITFPTEHDYFGHWCLIKIHIRIFRKIDSYFEKHWKALKRMADGSKKARNQSFWIHVQMPIHIDSNIYISKVPIFR